MKTLKDFAMCVPECFLAAISQYNFQRGDIIYDTPEAYTVWSNALQHINFFVQVGTAVSGREGNISFSVFRPNLDKTAAIRVTSVRTTQETFVGLLRSGDIQPFLDNGDLPSITHAHSLAGEI